MLNFLLFQLQNLSSTMGDKGGFDMPISGEQFEKGIDEENVDKTKYKILEFLARRPDEAFTAREITKAIGLPSGKAVGALSGRALEAYMNLESLVTDGEVDKKTIRGGKYYRIHKKSAPA